MKDIHQVLELSGGSIDKAINFAKKLIKENGYDEPSTNVCEFAEYFKAYMKH